MATWDDLVKRGQAWADNIRRSYAAGQQQTNALGPELAGAAQNYRESGLQPLYSPTPAAMKPFSDENRPPASEGLVNPNYRPIGGQNAVNRVLREKK